MSYLTIHAITNLTTENVSYPETFLEIGFRERHAKYRGNHHIALNPGFSTHVPDGKIFHEHDSCQFLGDAPENLWRRPFLENFLTR